MNPTRKNTWAPLAIAALSALVLVSPALESVAEARRGRGRGGDGARVDARVRLSEAVDAPFSVREAKLRLRRKKTTRQRVKLEVDGAPRGLDLRLFMDDASGTATRIGALREKRAGTYVWRVRTRNGGVLPFGVADVSELSGRDVEVRTASGARVLVGTTPTVAAASNAKSAKSRVGLAVDATVAESVASAATGSSVSARVSVRSKRSREELRIQVERVDPTAALTAFMDDGYRSSCRDRDPHPGRRRRRGRAASAVPHRP